MRATKEHLFQKLGIAAEYSAAPWRRIVAEKLVQPVTGTNGKLYEYDEASFERMCELTKYERQKSVGKMEPTGKQFDPAKDYKPSRTRVSAMLTPENRWRLEHLRRIAGEPMGIY